MTVESVTQAVSNLALQFGEEDADPGAMVTLSRVWESGVRAKWVSVGDLYTTLHRSALIWILYCKAMYVVII